MKVLRVPVESLSAGDHELDRDTSHYVLQVHRTRSGAPLVLFDALKGEEAEATLLPPNGKTAICRVSVVRKSRAVPRRTITLIQAFAKGDKMDRVVRDATALGATRIVIVVTSRCVAQLDAEGSENRRQRWQRIAVEAARQSGRGNIPELVGPVALEVAADCTADCALRLLLSPAASERLSTAVLRQAVQPAVICIGPEGGLTDDEESLLRARGFQSVRFGDFTLRTETAATAVLGALVDWGTA